MSNFLGGGGGLAYRGTKAQQPPNCVFSPVDPTVYDVAYSLLDIWLNTTDNQPWILISLKGNTLTQGARATWIPFGGIGNVKTLTGNFGGPVSPSNGTGNINVEGDGITINAVGNPGTNTITFSATGIIADTYVANTGSAVPAGGVLNVLGTTNIATSGSGNTLDIALNGIIPIAHGGTNTGSFANTDGVVYFDGTSLTTTTVGSATEVLTSNGPGLPPTFQPVGGGGGGALACGFLAVQETNLANATGDGTVYSLGSGVALTTIFDVGGDITPGDGAGTPAIFTAPATGKYCLQIGVLLTNETVGVFNDSVGAYGIVTPSKTYLTEFSPLGLFAANAMVSPVGSLSQTYFVDLNAGDQVTWTVSTNLNGGGGTRNIGVGGQADPVQTFIAGFVATGAGVLTVSAGANISLTGTAANPIINVAGTTNHAVQVGTGTTGLTSLAVGTNGQVLLGSAGANPVFANLTSTGGTITFTTGPGTLNLEAGGASAYSSVNTTPYVVAATDQFLAVDCSGGPITVQLPNAPATGKIFTIKDSTGSSATNTITITTVGGTVTLDGATSYTMNTNYAAIEVIFSGTAYNIF